MSVQSVQSLAEGLTVVKEHLRLLLIASFLKVSLPPFPHSFIPAHFIQLFFPIHKPRFLDSALKVATFNQFYAHNMRIVQLVLFSHASRSLGEFPPSGVGKLPPSMIFVRGNLSILKINFLLYASVFCIK